MLDEAEEIVDKPKTKLKRQLSWSQKIFQDSIVLSKSPPTHGLVAPLSTKLWPCRRRNKADTGGRKFQAVGWAKDCRLLPWRQAAKDAMGGEVMKKYMVLPSSGLCIGCPLKIAYALIE